MGRDSHPFGKHGDWNDVLRLLQRHARSRYRHVTREWVEDAISEAMEALLSYWLTTNGAKFRPEDPSRNFNFAVSYGKRRITRSLRAQMRRLETEEIGLPHFHPDPEDNEPTPEVATLDHESRENLREWLLEQPPEVLEGWLQGVLDGSSVRQEAEDRGMSKTQVHRNRKRGAANLRPLAERRGWR